MTVTRGWTDPPVVEEPVVVRPRTILSLVLDDPKFGGLRISCRSQSFAEWTDDGATILWPGTNGTEAEHNAYWRAIGARFVQHIAEWNLTDDHGAPEPVTVEALLSLDRSVVMDLIKAWGEAQSGKVDAPLDSDSPDGKPSVEQSIETETLSPSLAS